MLKRGLLGCGRIAQLVHLPALGRIPDAELVAFADPSSERLEEARRRVPGAQLNVR